MALYKVVSDPNSAVPRFGGVDAYLVQANSANEAKSIAKNQVDGDANAVWDSATVTDLSGVVAAPMTGWAFRVQVNTGTPVDVTVTGDADDTIDDIGTKLAAALLTAVGTAISGTAHSAYNSSTNLLTIASIADGIGDKNVTVTVTPPAGRLYGDVLIDSPAGAVVDLGIAGAVLTLQLSTSYVNPGVIGGYKA